MKKRYKFLGRLSLSTGLPLEYAAGLPHIEVDGFSRVRIECHHGVLQYSSNMVELIARGAHIRINGNGLGINSLSPVLAVISGQINGVEYIFGEDS